MGHAFLEPLNFHIASVHAEGPYHLVAKSRQHAPWFLAWNDVQIIRCSLPFTSDHTVNEDRADSYFQHKVDSGYQLGATHLIFYETCTHGL